MREVVLKLTSQKDVVKHQSDATTFGELKKEMRQIKWSGMRVVERSTKTTLQMDDAILPQGDFILFLVPEKVKSGKKTSGGAESLSGPVEDCKYNELRSHMSWLNRNKAANLEVSGGTPDLQKVLKKYYKKTGIGDAVEAVAEAKKPVAKAEKAEKTAKYVASKKQADEDDEDYEDRITFEKKAFDKKVKKAAAKAEEERIAAEKKEKEAAEKKAADKIPSKTNTKKVEKVKKKGFFGLGGKKEETPVDPIAKIEAARNNINEAVDEIVRDHISGAAPIVPGGPLEYSLKGLEEELKKIHRALRTSRSSASYID